MSMQNRTHFAREQCSIEIVKPMESIKIFAILIRFNGDYVRVWVTKLIFDRAILLALWASSHVFPLKSPHTVASK